MSCGDNSSDSDWNEQQRRRLRQCYMSHKPKYSQKFCEKWLTLFNPWLARCADDPNKPFCRACQCRLDCNRCHLQRHERTSKHNRNLDILINNGEGAAKQSLTIRQESSKYYQQRKSNPPLLTMDSNNLGIDTSEHFIDEADPVSEEDNFQYDESDSSVRFTYETPLKQEEHSGDEIELNSPSITHIVDKNDLSRDQMKMLMRIKQNKSDMMESYNEVIGPYRSPSTERNHVDLFFESVSSSVKALSPKLMAEAKMRVSQLICELELRALTESDVNSITSPGSVVMTTDQGAVAGAYIINHPQVGKLVHSGSGAHVEDGHHYETLA